MEQWKWIKTQLIKDRLDNVFEFHSELSTKEGGNSVLYHRADWKIESKDMSLIASAPEMLEEHKAWAKNIGLAFMRALQGDYTEVDILAKNTLLDFIDGEPHIQSNIITKAEGKEPV